MKLRYLFSTIIASALMLVGCTPESIDSFENIKLSKTYLSIPVEGGSVSVTVTASCDWKFLEKSGEWPKCMVKDKDDNDVEVDAWLTVDKMSGNAGETVVTFTAGEASTGREFELEIKAGNNTQFLRVRQGSLLAEMATCADIIAGPDGKNYKAKGICTSIASDYYGNWYLDDGTGNIYIYGTVNADGEYDWASFGIEVGDSVYVEGPKTTYNGTVELVKVTVSKVVKALLALPEETGKIEKTAQDHVFKVAYKGRGVFVEVDDNAKSWITYKSMDFKKGVPSKLEPNPADTALVTVSVAAVPDDLQKPREGMVVVKSYLSESESTKGVYTIKQMGHTPTVSPINTLTQQDATDKKYVRVEGVVAALSTMGLIVADETGALVVYYGSSFAKNNKFEIGNKIAIQGTVAINNFGVQVSPDYDELLDDTTTMTYGEAEVYDGDKLNAVLKELIDGGHGSDKKTYYGVQTEYATMSGELVYDGKYFNLNVDGATKPASLYNPDAALKLDKFNGKNVVLKGYVFSVSCSGSNSVPTYVYMMVTEAEIDNIIYKESFKTSIGAYTIDNKALDGLTYVWTHDKYGYMKASAYSGGAKAAESWLVSPEYDLAGQTAVYLSFDHILNYLKTDAREDHVSVLVKEKTATEWTALNGITWPKGDTWNAVNSGKVDLSSYAGKVIQIAFKYEGNTKGTGNTPTWEVYNIKLTVN